ncbi:sensor histidine kinase [Spirosoma rigui]|uniref:sensor histidine kinase n=1 Tax=Spirosoma rigui TaxID=564064 RepID=UPI0009B0A912|nr:HAMP domain-containing sensor histidine kinase [Spirosoma rigui]
MNLRSRIVLAVATVFAAVSLLAGWLMLVRAEASLQTAFDRSVQTRASWLLSMVSVDPVIIPLPTETERMWLTEQSYGRSRELFRSPGLDTGGRVTDQPPALTPGGDANVQHSYRTVTVTANRDQLPGNRIRLSLSVPDNSLRQDISRLRWVFGLGWLLSLLMAFGAGYVVASWLLKPIQTIARQADSISNAVSIDPIPLPAARDELFQLTDSLNRMLGRVRQSAELQQNFFGAAAHELRTPLAIMKTGLEVTLNRGTVDDQTAPFLTGQLDEVRRLTRLLDEFLSLSRPDSSPQPPRLDVVDVPELVDRCRTQLSTIAQDYGVFLVVESMTDSLTPLTTDALKVEHILLNLLENAIKYAVPGSAIRVYLRQTTDWTIRIQNETSQEQGPVVDLLEAYYQADPLRDGHGLGLWISHRLTALLGGQLLLNWQQFTFTSDLTLPVSR